MPIPLTTETDLTFLYFILALNIEGAEGSTEAMKLPTFHSSAARQIVNYLITQEEEEKLVKLMTELREKNSSLLDQANLFKEENLESAEGTIARKIFLQVEILVPDSLTLLALIKIAPDHFQESYGILEEVWKDLEFTKGIEKNKNIAKENKENSFKEKMIQIKNSSKNAVLKALDELEKLVNDIKNEEEESEECDIEEYCKTIFKKIEKELKENSIEASQLDAELQNELTKLKQGEVNREEIDEIKKKISDNIKLKKIEKELNNLLGSYKQKNSSKARKRLLRKINDFTKNNNPFYQQVYQKRKVEIENMIKQLETDNYSQQIYSSKDNFPFAIKSMIGVYLLTSLIIIFKNISKSRK